MVEYLLKKGADPNLNLSGYAIGTAVHCVCNNFNVSNVDQQLNLNLLKLLLRYEGSLHIKIAGVIARFGDETYK